MAEPNLSSFIWSVADLLRGNYKQSEYGKVILPFTVLRRLDCVLEPTKAAALAEKARCAPGRLVLVAPLEHSPVPELYCDQTRHSKGHALPQSREPRSPPCDAKRHAQHCNHGTLENGRLTTSVAIEQ
jgi:hypothetical protein